MLKLIAQTSERKDMGNWNGIPIADMYGVMNNGALAVMLCFGFGTILVSKQIDRVVRSQSWSSLIGAINRVRDNQELIENIQLDTHQINDHSTELIELAKTLNSKINKVGQISHKQHEILLGELAQIRKQLESKIT